MLFGGWLNGKGRPGGAALWGEGGVEERGLLVLLDGELVVEGVVEEGVGVGGCG